ncbi:hypothetical protein R6Q59_024277 [Mikania micrantha]
MGRFEDTGFADFEADTGIVFFYLLISNKVKVEQEVEQEVESDVEKSAASVKQHIDVTSIDMVATSIDMAASKSNSTCVAKPEKLDYDELPKEMNEMKIKEATIVNGNVTEKGQIILTSVVGRFGQPKTSIHSLTYLIMNYYCLFYSKSTKNQL